VPPTATNTSVPPPTNTPAPPTECMSLGKKISTIVGILVRYNAHEGSRRYRASLDLNHDGVLNIDDLAIVVETPTCRRHFRWF